MKRSSLRDTALVIALAALAGFTYNAFSSKGLPIIREAPAKVAVSDEELFGIPEKAGEASGAHPDSGVVFRIITRAQLLKILESGSAMLADARETSEYEEGHIGGAVNMNAMKPEEYLDWMVELPRDTMVVIYCGNPVCHYGRTLAEFMGSFGFTNLLLYDEGWDDWTAAGLPGVAGPAPSNAGTAGTGSRKEGP